LWLWTRRLSPRSRLRRGAIRLLFPRALEALNRGDLEAFSIFVHPEIESVNTPEVVALGGLVAGSRGRETWIEGQRRWLADWGELRYEPDEVLDLGGDRFLLLGRGRGTGRVSGIELDTEWGLLASISDGLLAREQNFLDKAEALKAAGLSEYTMSQENVETVQHLLAAWNRQDIDGVVALGDPEIEYVNAPGAVEPGTRRGLAEFAAVLRAQWDSLPDAHAEIARIHARGDEVIVESVVSRTMPGSDTRVGNPVLLSFKVRGGRIARMAVLGVGSEVQAALEAVGLSE
jgi:ketosteroid isomerase-like protein